MGFLVVSALMYEKHMNEHQEVNQKCPLCKKYGASPQGEGSTGRMIAVNSPQKSDPNEW